MSSKHFTFDQLCQNGHMSCTPLIPMFYIGRKFLKKVKQLLFNEKFLLK